MTRCAWLVGTVLATLSLTVRPADFDAGLSAAARAMEPKLLEWRRDFHQNPELSNREFRTAAKVAAHLESLGLEVRTGIAHTGVAAVRISSVSW